MGEHDIAVTMDKLKFVEEPANESHCARDHDARNDDRDWNGPIEHHHNNDNYDRAQRQCEYWTPDHAVMSGNKEQLKAMPQFKYSDYN